jgi:HSP20 family protein
LFNQGKVVIKIAFDLALFTRHRDPDLWDAFLEVPHIHFGEYDSGVPLEVSETKDTVIVEAEMPGMNSKDLDISLNGDLLTIRGEKKQERKIESSDCYCSERTYGKFSRSVRLPANVKHDSKIKASYKDGIVRIEIPKAESKTIQIAPSYSERLK